MNARDERDLLNIIRSGKTDNMPDLRWESPSGIVALFLSGRVFFEESTAWDFFKERKRINNEAEPSKEEFKAFVFNLNRTPSAVLTKTYLTFALKREVSVPEMGRLIQKAKSWFKE